MLFIDSSVVLHLVCIGFYNKEPSKKRDDIVRKASLQDISEGKTLQHIKRNLLVCKNVHKSRYRCILTVSIKSLHTKYSDTNFNLKGVAVCSV